MREIKFQLIWQGAIYEPITLQELAWGQWELEGKMYKEDNHGNEKGDSVSIPRKDYIFFSEEEDDFGIWRQFTGLLDKNGKEIYESDFCELSAPTAPANGTARGIIRFRNGQFELQNNERYWTMDDVLRSNFALKVIGNRFENPDLIS